MAVDSETIKASARAVRTLAQPHVFPVAVALAALALAVVPLYWMRQDAIEQRTAFLAALKDNTTAVERLGERINSNSQILGERVLTNSAAIDSVRKDMDRIERERRGR